MTTILSFPRRLSEREAAAYLGLSPRTLQDWRTKGVGMPYAKVGRRVSYAAADLDAFLVSVRVEPKASPSKVVDEEGCR